MELITTHEEIIDDLNEEREGIECYDTVSPPGLVRQEDWYELPCGVCSNCQREKEIGKEIHFRAQRIKELIIQFGKEKHEMRKKAFQNRMSDFMFRVK